MAVGQRNDPFGGFNFLVEIDGIALARFSEVSGLDSTIDVIEYREGGTNATPRKLPGMTKYSNVTLKRGITDNTELYEWHRDAVQGSVSRRNGSIVLLNLAGEEVTRWNFFEGWPTKYTGPDLNATGTEVAVETVEIAHEGLQKST